MPQDVKPVIVVSRCLGFANCRWNGDTINDKFVELLKEHVQFLDYCPEFDIGLGVPRNPVRLVRSDNKDQPRLMQPATGDDVTDKFLEYSHNVVNNLQTVDGFLLKNASPSCGLNNIKLYASIKKGSSVGKTAGMFAQIARDRFPSLPFEDEGRLKNYVLRENWLIAVFTIARLRLLQSSHSFKKLYDFHAQHKYLFMSYSQSKLRELGHVIANHEKLDFDSIYSRYRSLMLLLLAAKPNISRRINALMHMFGYFSKELSQDEKRYFLNVLEEYRRGAMPVKVPLELIKSWAVRFKNEYILNQIILDPYPDKLLLLSDSGRGRSL